jgi:hypothetical protein
MPNFFCNVVEKKPVLFAPDELRIRVMRIVTDSRRPEEPKDPEPCNLFENYIVTLHRCPMCRA